MGDERKPGRGNDDQDGQVVLDRKAKTKRPTLYKVLFHNDDYTSMEFVVWVLKEVFHLSDTEATHLMLTVHHKGLAVAGVFTRDIADTKAQKVMLLAQEHQMPLLCTTEPDQ